MNILKDLPELIKANVITEDTAHRIQDYYNGRKTTNSNRLFIVFGILGSILVGLGIILIVAHNWDELSRGTKTVIVFLPLFLGQLLCGYVLFKRPESVAWREGASAFLFFSIGACIALVSQVYNIPGETGTFLLTWMLLCFPLIYLMNASLTSLLFLCGITYYASTIGYWSYPSSQPYLYWLLLLGVLPHYYRLYKERPQSNFLIFHNWIIPLSIIIAMGTIAHKTEELMFIAYFSLFGLFYLIGNLDFFNAGKTRNNGYMILGSLGTIILLLVLSFGWFWDDIRVEGFQFNEVIVSPEFIVSAVVSLLAGWILYRHFKSRTLNAWEPLAIIFILFIITFIIGIFSPIAVVLINLYILALGILTIRKGAVKDHLGILNFGLLIITALVICRFFDTNISFVIRGLLFMIVGASFFAANYYILKNRKANA